MEKHKDCGECSMKSYVWLEIENVKYDYIWYIGIGMLTFNLKHYKQLL